MKHNASEEVTVSAQSPAQSDAPCKAWLGYGLCPVGLQKKKKKKIQLSN